MKKLILFLLVLSSLPFGRLMAQGHKVTGVVTDAGGAPLVGASVAEKGAADNATATSAQGTFSLTLRNSNTLVITSVGMLPMEVNASSATVIVKMNVDPKGLDEVVVVGYGRQKKVTVTGSVSTVSGTSLRENPSASLQNGLVGKLPGFSAQQRSGRPGADGAAFFIRGISTFSSAGTPLIIVDDIEYSADLFAQLDPNEIESISILKDAATTAVYGIKGANGVVVVTTRRGKTGSPKISLRSEYATMEPTIMPEYLNAYQTASLYNQSQINDNKYSASPVSNYQPRFTATDLQLFQDGTDPYGHPDVDWQSVLFRKFSHQTRSNLDIQGGTNTVKYFVSVGYINQGGILNDFSKGQGVDGNYYNKRFNYRSNLDIHASKNLDFRVDLYGNTSAVNNPSLRYNGKVNGDKNDAFYEYSSFLSLAPFAYPIKNPDGSWGYSNWQKGQTTYDANNIVGRLNLDGYERNFQDNMNFVASVTEKLDFITKGLAVKGLVSYGSNYNYGRNVTRQNFPSFVYDPVNNLYAARDVNVYRTEPLTLSYAPRSTFRDFTMQAQASYDRTFGSHHFYGLALLNRNTKTFTTSDVNYNFIPNNFQGISTRIGYDFKQKYLVEFDMAYNGSDRFQGNKRFGLFPAVSVGYNIAEEDFFKNLFPAINLLKLRGSYGIVGNDQIGNAFTYYYRQSFGYNTTGWSNSNTSLTSFPLNRIAQANFGTSSNPFTNLQEGTLPNLDVTWEKAGKTNIALDFGVLNNKISGTLEWFNEDRYDILTQRGTVSQILGQTLPPVNIGKVNNRGYEAEITYHDRIGKDFDFSVRATYSYAKNKIMELDEVPTIYNYQQLTGQSIGSLLMYKWTGSYYKDAADVAASPKVTTGGITPVHAGDLKYEDINKDGVVNEFDRGFFGAPNLPRLNYGFQIQLGYKKLRVSASFQGTGDFSVSGIEEAIRAFSSNLRSVHANAWTPELGDNAQYPILTQLRGISDPGQNSTFWSRSGKYLRLRTADISYSLPARWVRSMKISDMRVYVNGNNLVTWSKFFKLYDMDPEVTPFTDRTVYPPQKVFNVGVNVIF